MSASAQLDLFAAKQARDRGIERVLNSPRVLYRERIWKAITDFALQPEPFSADDLRDELGDPPADCSPNVVGAQIITALRRKVIREIGTTRSRRVIGHANKIGLYIGEGFGA